MLVPSLSIGGLGPSSTDTNFLVTTMPSGLMARSSTSPFGTAEASAEIWWFWSWEFGRRVQSPWPSGCSRLSAPVGREDRSEVALELFVKMEPPNFLNVSLTEV